MAIGLFAIVDGIGGLLTTSFLRGHGKAAVRVRHRFVRRKGDGGVFEVNEQVDMGSGDVRRVPQERLTNVVRPYVDRLINARIVMIIRRTIRGTLNFLLFICRVVNMEGTISQLISITVISSRSNRIINLMASPQFTRWKVRFDLRHLFAKVRLGRTFKIIKNRRRNIPYVNLAMRMLMVKVVQVRVLGPTAVIGLASPGTNEKIR